MRKLAIIIMGIIILSTIAVGQNNVVDSIRVFYLGGQSNMDGFGKNTDLPETLSKPFDKVWIFHGNPEVDDMKTGGLGKWEILKPGHGNGFKSDGLNNNLSELFGVELSFAKKLQELYPNEKIALIKYSRGGTSIDSHATHDFGNWDPDYNRNSGINQYDHFLTTIKKAFNIKDINDDGKDDYLIPSGIIWMQGESDAIDEEVALRYYSNLKRLMDLIRAALHEDDLPVVIGKISDSGNNKYGKVWKFGELVQYAQEKFVIEDGNSAIIRSTMNYKYSDPFHYDSDSYIDLGVKFADAIYRLNKENAGYKK